MPQPFLLLIAVNLAHAGCLGWKWSLLSVTTWLAVQRIKAVFFLTLYDIINDMKLFWTVCITPQPWHSHFCCWLLPILTSWMFGLKTELMACADLVGGTTEQSCIFSDLIWYYQWYETLSNCLHYTSAVPHPFLLLMSDVLTEAGCLGWKLSVCPVPTWLAVQRSKAVFFLTLYDIYNDMKHLRNFCIIPQPLHSHFCCWLLPMLPKLDVWAENGAYGLSRLVWRYNGAKLYFSWPYMILSMI